MMLSVEQRDALLRTLQTRFEANMQRHEGLSWADVVQRLEAHDDKLWSLHEMERTGGEPDVVGLDVATGELLFYDCAAESPAGRRNVCYDRAALESRKAHKPETSAVDMAAAMGIALMTEDAYFMLQALGDFDTRTGSWLHTPDDVRGQGGGLFGSCRYGRAFICYNGAQSYYKDRGFRGVLHV